KTKRHKHEFDLHTQRDSHVVIARPRARVPVIMNGAIPHPERDAEENARMKLIYFMPFRRGSDLKGSHATWQAALAAYVSSLPPESIIRHWLVNVDSLHQGESQRELDRKEQQDDPQRH